VRRPHGSYAIRYAGYGEVGIYEQLYWMNRARNLQEWLAAMRIQGLPMFNVGYADRQGNILYLYNARLPVRAEAYDWSVSLPGNTSETLWTEYLPFQDLPQVLNPASGFLQNCNSSPFHTTTGDGNPRAQDFSSTLGIEDRMTNRSLRALEILGSDESITEEEFYGYKYDMAYSTQGDMPRYIELILEAPLPEDPDVQSALEAVQSWDLRTTPENTAAGLVIWTLASLDYPLPDEINTLRLAEAFVETVELFKETHGRVDVPWSEVNRLRRGNLDLGMGGGPDILHAVSGSMLEDGHLVGSQGDSYVMLITWAPDGQVSSRSIHQYGSATLDRDSPHYADQAPLFANRQLKPVWLDEAEIRQHLEREYRPGEEMEETQP
jgi:penicillin amidase/acyl-homoserine-lactone acylase